MWAESHVLIVLRDWIASTMILRYCIPGICDVGIGRAAAKACVVPVRTKRVGTFT